MIAEEVDKQDHGTRVVQRGTRREWGILGFTTKEGRSFYMSKSKGEEGGTTQRDGKKLSTILLGLNYPSTHTPRQR